MASGCQAPNRYEDKSFGISRGKKEMIVWDQNVAFCFHFAACLCLCLWLCIYLCLCKAHLQGSWCCSSDAVALLVELPEKGSAAQLPVEAEHQQVLREELLMWELG